MLFLIGAFGRPYNRPTYQHLSVVICFLPRGKAVALMCLSFYPKSIGESRYSHSHSRERYSNSHKRAPHSSRYSHYRRTGHPQSDRPLFYHHFNNYQYRITDSVLRSSGYALRPTRKGSGATLRSATQRAKSKGESRHPHPHTRERKTKPQKRAPHPSRNPHHRRTGHPGGKFPTRGWRYRSCRPHKWLNLLRWNSV